MEQPPVVPERGSGVTAAWAAVALACVGVLMLAGFATRGSEQMAEVALGLWPYVVYFLLLVSVLNVCVELWWRSRWYLRYVMGQLEKRRNAYVTALAMSKNIPGSDPSKLARMLRDEDK